MALPPMRNWRVPDFDDDVAETGHAELGGSQHADHHTGDQLQRGPGADRHLHDRAQCAEQCAEHAVGDELADQEATDGCEIVGEPIERTLGCFGPHGGVSGLGRGGVAMLAGDQAREQSALDCGT
ncbi:hypothetical protein GCM10027597_32040 [Saccharopolyspora tripterygii]